MSSIKALTVSQPYASLIASGEKWVENRTWYTDYRGQLAIHAGKTTQYLTEAELAEYPTGSVLCCVDLVACVYVREVEGVATISSESRTALVEAGVNPEQFLEHDHTEGPHCLVLRNLRQFREPVEARGKPGLWDWQVPAPKRPTSTPAIDRNREQLRAHKWQRNMCLDTDEGGVIVDACDSLGIVRVVRTPKGALQGKLTYAIQADGADAPEFDTLEALVAELERRGVFEQVSA